MDRARLKSAAGIVAIAYAMGAAVLEFFQSAGSVAYYVEERSLFKALLPVLHVALWILVFLAALFVWKRQPRSVGQRAGLAGVLIAYWVGNYAASLVFQESGDYYRGFFTGHPNDTIRMPKPHLPDLAYRLNSHGLRMPDWSESRTPGVHRAAFLGDSFVFGAGVEEKDTITAQWLDQMRERRPAEKWEALNLGVRGYALNNYVDMIETLSPVLTPDVWVVCTMLSNDLSALDMNYMVHAQRRPSWLGLGYWILGGQGGSALFGTMFSGTSPLVLEKQWGRLTKWRQKHGDPPIIFLPYDGLEVLKKSPPIANTYFVDPGPQNPDHFFLGDGHPTPAGNRFFAAAILDAMNSLPQQ